MPRLTKNEFERLLCLPPIQLTLDEIDRIRRSRKCNDPDYDNLNVTLNNEIIGRGYAKPDPEALPQGPWSGPPRMIVDEKAFRKALRQERRTNMS